MTADLESRTERLALDLELAVRELRAGVAAGGLTVPAQRRMVRTLAPMAALVAELRGALDAYRTCAIGRSMGAPLDLDARPLHVSDEEIR